MMRRYTNPHLPYITLTYIKNTCTHELQSLCMVLLRALQQMLHRKLNDDHISHVMVTMSNVSESELMVVMSVSYLLDFCDFLFV